MPYDLEKTPQGVYVVNSDTGKRKNKEPLSEAKAKDYMAALYAAEGGSTQKGIQGAIIDTVLVTLKHLGSKHNQKVHGSRYTKTAAQIRQEAKKRADSEWTELDSWRFGSRDRYANRLYREGLSNRTKVEKKPDKPVEPPKREPTSAEVVSGKFFNGGTVKRVTGKEALTASEFHEALYGYKNAKTKRPGFENVKKTEETLDNAVDQGFISKHGDKYTHNKPGFPNKDQVAITKSDIKRMEAEKSKLQPFGKDQGKQWKDLETKIDVAYTRLQDFKTGQNFMKEAMQKMKDYDFGNNLPLLSLKRDVPGGFLFFGKNGEVFLYSDIEKIVGAGQPIAVMEMK